MTNDPLLLQALQSVRASARKAGVGEFVLLDYRASRSASEEVMGHKVSKVRQCHECKEVFATPDSFRQHKYMGGHCRSVEALNFAGFVKTSKGWKKVNEAT